LVAKLRNRSVGEHARLLPDYWESQRALWRARRLARSPQRLGAQPGQPIYRRERYLAFRIIQSAAVAAHVPEPLAVSAVLVRVDGSRASSFMIRPLVSTLEVVEVGGDHYSVLQYPHVMGVADELRRAVERLDDRRRDRVDRSG
jgi:thioesterase domain-containing protein